MSDVNAPSFIDFDVLRGWREHRDPELQQPHRLPALAQLEMLGDDGDPKVQYSLHGPQVMLGRYRPQHGPVDLHLPRLKDHQRYRLGAPHAQLELKEGRWQVEAVNPRASTEVDGVSHEYLHEPRPLEDGMELKLGVVRFRFQSTDISVDDWQSARDELIQQVDGPALFLKRAGGICGPYRRLDERHQLVVGRSHPGPGELPDSGQWPPVPESFWDLSGLFDHERNLVGFQHVAVSCEDDGWYARELSTRQDTFVNRVAITAEKTVLSNGDELALGSVIVRFHDPADGADQTPRQHIPTVVDWQEEKPPDQMNVPPDPGEDS